MSSGIKVKLSDAFDLQMGKTPSRSVSSYWEGEHSWVSISDLSDSGKYIAKTKECITDEAIKDSKIKIVPKGTVIMSFKLSIGKTAITASDIFTNEAIIAFHDKGKYIIDPEYMYYFCCGNNWLKGTNKAVMGLTLNKNTLSNYLINIPSLLDQKKIISKLNQISEVIENRQRTLTLLDELVKSRFVEMFGDVKLNAKKWHEEKLGTLVEVGSSKRVFVEELQDEGIPFYRGTEIGQLAERLDIKPELYITQEHYQELCKASGKPCKDDLLMPSICLDGRIWQVDTDKPFYFKDGRVLWIHNICDDINVTFLRYVLKVKFEVDYDKIASGTTFKELKIFILKNLPIIVPSLDLQNQFADFVRQIDVTKTAVQRQLDELQILRAKLMQDYFD